ncbi:estradiol 17-beta-dehydrogenase [Trifolium pratense]|uniref:Estradiol 17-beta-dehydrogenase n=1 Tax=Trifolium pratense TaxID=57577 RepID=A0A2K3PAW8_TRIPR|nr:estradiol 17-beta-dehydrogenase [Trifolium pratense]
METGTQILDRAANHMLENWNMANHIRPRQAAGNSMLVPAASVPEPEKNNNGHPQPAILCLNRSINGRYKCNIDASFSLHRNHIGIGMCIRDDEGRIVMWT